MTCNACRRPKLPDTFRLPLGLQSFLFFFVYVQGSCRIIQQVHTSDLKSWIKSLPRELRQAIRVRSISTSFRMWCLFVTLLQNKLSTALHLSLASHLQIVLLVCCSVAICCLHASSYCFHQLLFCIRALHGPSKNWPKIGLKALADKPRILQTALCFL